MIENLEKAVLDFINQRPEYVKACRNCNGDNHADYWRWNGGAEARRQLAQSLGLTVPYEFGDKATPDPKASARKKIADNQCACRELGIPDPKHHSDCPDGQGGEA